MPLTKDQIASATLVDLGIDINAAAESDLIKLHDARELIHGQERRMDQSPGSPAVR